MIKKSCTCERKEHTAPIEQIVIGHGVLKKLPEILSAYQTVFMVCDENTYTAVGEQVEAILTEAGKFSHKLVLPGDSVPTYETCGKILMHMQDFVKEEQVGRFLRPDFLLAVGSGVINDTVKLVSFRTGVPYGVVASAPSMDGYASSGAPLMVMNSKRTVRCVPPSVIVGDTAILKDAPMELLYAGIGDMFGKYFAMFDWELAREMVGEYYCPVIAAEVMEATDKCLQNGRKMATRDEGVMQNIMEGLIVTGLGMSYTGNSRPASGCEHMVAHVWEIEDIYAGLVPQLHGVEVCVATRIVTLMLTRLRKETEDEKLILLLDRYLPYLAEVEAFCREVNFPVTVKDPVRIENSILKALHLRNRYTVLTYLNDRGLLESYAKEAAAEFVANL